LRHKQYLRRGHNINPDALLPRCPSKRLHQAPNSRFWNRILNTSVPINIRRKTAFQDQAPIALKTILLLKAAEIVQRKSGGIQDSFEVYIKIV
jgi:hypothetical protein